MFKVRHNVVPEIICSLFNERNELVHRPTRQSEYYTFPPIGGQLLDKSLFYQGPKIFNRILKEENLQIN